MDTIDKYEPTHPLLKPVISSIVFWRRSGSCAESIISLPINISGFGFTLYGDLYVKTGASTNKMPAYGTRNLLAQPSEITTAGNFLNISVRCNIPKGLCLFTRTPMNVIHQDYAIALEDIFSRQQICDLTEQLGETPSDARRLAILESFLVARLVNDYPPLFGEMVCFIHSSKGCFNLAYISRHYGISERTINRYFNKYIGVSPNAYINLIRFRSVISLSANEFVKLLSHAFEVGYYDQSHFIKHFKEYSSLTPTQFFRSGKKSGVSDFYNL